MFLETAFKFLFLPLRKEHKLELNSQALIGQTINRYQISQYLSRKEVLEILYQFSISSNLKR